MVVIKNSIFFLSLLLAISFTRVTALFFDPEDKGMRIVICATWPSNGAVRGAKLKQQPLKVY
jgi:hypothetical protein